MGQARIRGTYEERKAAAIERDKEALDQFKDRSIPRSRISPRRGVDAVTLFAIAAALNRLPKRGKP